jgi:predicted dienelactone hydrolase
VQHPGSDSIVWTNVPLAELPSEMRKAAANPQNAVNRPLDVSFAIDQLEKLNRDDSPLKNRLDLARIGVAGHSFGAFTTLAVAGEVFVAPGREVSFADPRVKAAMAMSAPVPVNKASLDQAFARIKIPCLHLTGTADFSPIGDTKPEDRRLPFEYINGADQILITFTGADHMTFAVRERLRNGEKDELFHELICASSTAFWDAYLKGDAGAKAWLTGGGFKSLLGRNGTMEEKLVATPGKDSRH